MQITDQNIIKALSTVQEPDLKKDLVTLQMIKDIKIEGKKVHVTVILTTPACPLKELIKKNCTEAILQLDPDLEVFVNLTSQVTTSRLDTSSLLSGVKNIIAIASGKGGVGKSTVTSNLAVALAATGASVGLIDADIFGPSMPVMFGIENEKPEMVKQAEKDYIIPIQKFGVSIMSIGFLVAPDNAIVWRGPMASSALRQFISDVLWGDLDYLLIDMPPGTSDIHLTLVQTVPVTGAVIVTTPQIVALSDAQKALAMFRQPQINVPVLGIIENMSCFTPQELPNNKYYIFGKDGGKTLAHKYQVPFIGEIPLVQSIRECSDSGLPIAIDDSPASKAFQAIAEELARQVALRNASLSQTKKVEVTT